jgi:hypothetical protein
MRTLKSRLQRCAVVTMHSVRITYTKEGIAVLVSPAKLVVLVLGYQKTCADTGLSRSLIP